MFSRLLFPVAFAVGAVGAVFKLVPLIIAAMAIAVMSGFVAVETHNKAAIVARPRSKPAKKAGK